MARKPVIPAPVIAPVEPVAERVVPPQTAVTNCLPGTVLHLGDGRKLAFGETAEVGEIMAAFLIERGQAS